MNAELQNTEISFAHLQALVQLARRNMPQGLSVGEYEALENIERDTNQLAMKVGELKALQALLDQADIHEVEN